MAEQGEPAPEGAGQNEGAGPDDGAKPEKSEQQVFSQADLERIVAERLSRERAKFKDYGDLKAKATKYDEAVEAQKTAEQRAQEAASAAQKRADDLLRRAVRGEIRALAAEKFADPDDPGGFLDATKYTSADGEVDIDAIRADLDDLLERKPHLAKAEPGARPPAPSRAQGSSGNGTPDVAVTPGLGRLRHAYATSKPTK